MKILIGCPTSDHYEYCLREYAERIKSLIYRDFGTLIVDNSEKEGYIKKIKSFRLNTVRGKYIDNLKERIAESRNIIRSYMLENDYDYFLSLEQDVIPPLDVINRLLRHKKDVVSGVYFKLYPYKILDKSKKILKEYKALVPLIFKFSDKKDKMDTCSAREVEGEQFFKIRACGLGCVLISKKVLEKIRFRYDPNLDTFDDFLFCSDVYKRGFDIYADTSVKCRHLFLKKGEIKDT